MTSLRILILSTQRNWYGGEEQAWQLARGLRRRGHHADLLVPEGSAAQTRLGAQQVSLHTFRGGGHAPAALAVIRRAAGDADVVHCNDPHALTACGLALTLAPRPPVVASRRVAFEPRSPWAYARWSDRVVCVSSAIRERCLRSGMPAERLRLVLDGVDPRRMAAGDRERGRAALGIPAGAKVVLCVASLRAAKGHADLVAAARRVLKENPDVYFFAAGEGPERRSLERQAADLGESMTFLGYRDDVPDLMAAADLFVLPSRDEGLGSSIIDAMLAGRPIVATRAGGIPELLVPEGCEEPLDGALLARPGDADDLAAAISRLLRRPGCTTTLRQRALEHFSADAMVRSTLDVYTELIG